MLDFGISIFEPLQISILKILLKLFDDEIKRVVLVDSYILLSFRNNLTKTYVLVSPNQNLYFAYLNMTIWFSYLRILKLPNT